MKMPFALLLPFLLPALLLAEPTPAPRPTPHPTPQQRPIVFTHVTVIDGTGVQPQPDRTIVITGQQISALGKTGSVAIPDGAQVIDANGKFLIPGLWDMHVHISGSHVEKEQFLSMCLANGVTGVRDMGGNLLETFHQWRQEMQEGTRIGPHIVAAGLMVEGPEPSWPLISIPVRTPDEGRQAVRSLIEQGAEFVKVYSRIPRDAYFALADECKKQQIPFAGHVTIFVTPAEASDAGQKSIEHLNGLLLACSTHEDEIKRRGPNQLIGEIVDTYSAQKAAALFAHFVKNQTWQVPTLAVRRAGAFIDDLASTPDARLKYILPSNRERWKPENDFRYKNRTAAQIADRKRLYQKELEVVGAMRRAGVPIMAGTDVGNPYVFPGFSLHDELALLVEAGLTPMEALQAATRNPAKFLERTDLGTVETGKIADLVLLDANPMEEIRNTRRIAAVVVGGRLLSKASLDAMLAEVAAAASRS
jgi:imidazolonepropionase-like amidohydrolase